MWLCWSSIAIRSLSVGISLWNIPKQLFHRYPGWDGSVQDAKAYWNDVDVDIIKVCLPKANLLLWWLPKYYWSPRTIGDFLDGRHRTGSWREKCRRNWCIGFARMWLRSTAMKRYFEKSPVGRESFTELVSLEIQQPKPDYSPASPREQETEGKYGGRTGFGAASTAGG
jgi:hypothetical protein